MYPVIAYGIRTGNPCDFNKGCSLKFHEGFGVQQTPEETWRTDQPKHCGNNNNNKDEDNSPKNLNDKNQQASSQKFREWKFFFFFRKFVLLYIWKENGNHLPLWDKVEIIDRAEHWRIRRLKESAHMLGYNDLLSRPSIELNTIWEPIIKKARSKKKLKSEYEHR